MATTRFSLNDPEWLAHRFVESDDAFRFIRLPRGDHDTVPFLTDDYLKVRESAPDVPALQCLELPGDAPLHFIFHSAFCSSTMLVRAFDRPGVAMGLSEPMILNDLVGFRRRGAEPRAVARAADAATRLLGRPFGPGEAVVVKPSNLVNPLALLLIMLRPQSRALFLHAPLETFLISVARKGIDCRLWVRELLEAFMRDGALDLPFTPEDYFRQTDLQVAAVGWLAQHQLFARLAERLGQERLRFLDSASLHAVPDATLGAIAKHFGLTLGSDAARDIVAGPVFARHSKSGQPYTAETRARDYAAVRSAHQDEIEKVVIWASAVAKSAGISLDPQFAALAATS
ncbi:hypothetical protein [Novosphingobium sp.]|uniref:hypothetical protein n=1 Tax=Novosphingobium sp. TaxID=1874826 RepID=UPI0025F32F3A|nr:hypothetical protein [Novosphingobium sp.]